MIDYRSVVIQWKEFKIPSALPRDISVQLNVDFIITLTGPRRAGKTYLCFHLINTLQKTGITKENILYINFEDEKLLNAKADDLEQLLNAYYELSEINNKQKIYLFLDEIQLVEQWDVWVRKIYDLHKNIQIIITGSSSKLLSREISTKLRGRIMNYEVFPLSFKEYLTWKNSPYNKKTISYSKQRFEIKKHFHTYLLEGGYPAPVAQKVPREPLLQNYYESMIFRDVVERYKIKEIKKLKLLANLLFESTSREISYTRLTNKLRSLGFSLSKNTVIEYISYFEDAYLFFQNLKYDYSLIKQLGSIKKIYCIDNGLLNAVSFSFSENPGKLLENLVYGELRRQGKQIYYHKGKNECDFIIAEKNKVVTAIQVTHKLTDENQKRELDGLREAAETYALTRGILLTSDQEEIKKVQGITIQILPVWKWLLDNKG